jgi:hypothetical protein
LTLNEGAIITNCYGAVNGGGIYNNNGIVNVNGGEITRNTAFYGGGIFNDGTGVINMTAGRISGNYASSEGGGIRAGQGEINISGGEINDNGSYLGGGIFVAYYSRLNITGGEICSNTAVNYGGGIMHRSNGNGSSVSIENALISGNSAGILGGGVYDENNNFPTNVIEIRNTVVSGNSAPNGGNLFSQLAGNIDFEPVLLSISASVEKLNGNKNSLTVSVCVLEYSVELKDTVTKEYSESFSISNNAADTYEVGGYTVYVDTKGNDQIRACYVVE